MARRSRKPANKRAVDFSNVGKSFQKDTDYRFKIKAAEWKDGNEHPYLAIELQGSDDEYENSSIYHNASMAPKALARTREFLEATGADIDFESGEVEIDCDELIGLEVMGTTYEDRYDGGKSIKVDEWWPVEDDTKAKGGKKSTKASGKSSKKEEPEDTIDFDEVSDADVKKLGKKLKVKAKTVDDIREALGELDVDDVREAAGELDISLGDDAGAAEDGDIDFAELSDKDVKKLGKAMGSKKKDPDEIRDDLGDMDVDEVKEKAEELDIELTFTPAEPEEPKGKKGGKAGKASSKRGSKKSGFSEDEVMEMSEEELEAAIEEHKLDVDLDDHKTLRKKKNAVIDALQAEDLITG